MTVGKMKKNNILRVNPTLAAMAVAACFSGAVLANPTNPTLVHGTANFSTAGNILNITNSPNAIINWGSFSIGVNELTRFIQQSGSSAVLNRVIGQDPSAIFGSLQSNGRVFLLNPNGIVFGASAQINVAGLVASTLNLSNDDFLNNRMKFTDGAGAGSVVNQGSITGGSVYLIGKAVTNDGLITSPNGDVILAAGNSVELVNPGTPNLRVEIVAPDNEAKNLGTVTADAGRIGIYAGLIQQSGTLRADSAVVEGGRIMLKASKNVHLAAASQTSASGVTGGRVDIQAVDTTIVEGDITATGSVGAGGTVQVLGNLVGLNGHASIDASGTTQGGTVLVGGDFQGKNPDVQNAFRTYVGQDVSIKADAITEGDGGKVIVWADDATRFYGHISARGGSNGGDGGFAEVSGKQFLDFQGAANLSATGGTVGTLLLDPASIEIATAGANTSDTTIDFGDPGTLSIITPATLNASSAAIVLQANDDITVTDAVSLANDGVSITLQAGGFITVQSSITTRGGAITLISGDPGSSTDPSEGAIFLNAGLDSTGGGALPAGADIRLTGLKTDLGTSTIDINAPINAGTAGNVILVAGINGFDVKQTISGTITGHGLYAEASNGDVLLDTAFNQVDHFAASASGIVKLKNARNLHLEDVDGNQGIVAAGVDGLGVGNVQLTLHNGSTVYYDLTADPGSTIVANGGGTTAIKINAASIGEVGGQIIEVDPGATGQVSLTAQVAGIYVEQVSGTMQTSRYTLSTPASQMIELVSSGGPLQVDSDLNFPTIDLALETKGTNNITFVGSHTVNAVNFTLEPDATNGSVIFTGSPAVWEINAPTTITGNRPMTLSGTATVNFNDSFSSGGAVTVGSGTALDFANGADLTTLNTAGTVSGGAFDVDSLTQTNGSISVASLTVNNSFSQTGTSAITGTSGDVKLNQASGNLVVKSASAHGKFKAVAASGDVVLTGASVSGANGPVELFASGNIDINGGSYVSSGSVSPSNIQMVATSGGVTIQNSSVNASYGGAIDITAATGITVSSSTQSTSVTSAGNVTLTSGGNVNVTGGSGASQWAMISGGLTTIDASGDVMVTGGAGAGSDAKIYGSSDVFMTVGGTVNLVTGSGTGSTAIIVVAGSPTSVHHPLRQPRQRRLFCQRRRRCYYRVRRDRLRFLLRAVLPFCRRSSNSSLIVTYGLTAPPPGGGSSGSSGESLEAPTQTLDCGAGRINRTARSREGQERVQGSRRRQEKRSAGLQITQAHRHHNPGCGRGFFLCRRFGPTVGV